MAIQRHSKIENGDEGNLSWSFKVKSGCCLEVSAPFWFFNLCLQMDMYVVKLITRYYESVNGLMGLYDATTKSVHAPRSNITVI